MNFSMFSDLIRTSRSFRKERFVFARWATLWFAVSICFAALVYPGGTIRDQSARGYSMFENLASDLGRTVALNGEPNRLGAAVFLIGFGLLVLAMLVCLPVFLAVYSSTPWQRSGARCAAAVGCLSCLGFLVVALTPVDVFPSLHRLSALVGWSGTALAALLWALVTARDARFSTRAALIWLVLAVVVSVYIGIDCLNIFRLSPDTNLLAQAIAQKVAGIVGLLAWLFQLRGAEHALSTSRSRPAATEVVS